MIASGALLACDSRVRDLDVTVVNAQVAALEDELKLKVGDELEGPRA